MLFNSVDFLIFFAVVYGAYVAVRSLTVQNVILIAASYFFYGYWKPVFLFLLFFTTVFNFFIGLILGQTHGDGPRKGVIVVAVIVNLSILGVFKYYNFGVENMAALLQALGFQASLGTLNVILPVGISFYTFQCIGYVVDVYSGRVAPTRNFLAFSLYVAYFPQLVAGPIERAERLLPQFLRPRAITRNDLGVGIVWIATGYFLKVAIADTLGPFVDYVYGHPDPYYASGVTTLIGILGFGLQIFGDFAGYSLIARGLGRLMGIKLMANFLGPMLAGNPREFWRRWHVSLSTWLRDYLYIPLGGNRKGEVRTYLNVMTTMLLGGLWHGAAWNFVAWGAYHGALLVAHRWLERRPWWGQLGAALRPFRLAGMFALVSFGWFLFRVHSYEQFKAMARNVLTNFHWEAQSGDALIVFVTALALTLAYQAWEEREGDRAWMMKISWPVRIGVVAFLALSVAGVGFEQTPFIYFQF